DGIRDKLVTGVQTCALPICRVRTDVPAILRLVEQGAIAPQRTITRRYALAEAPDAYAALDRGEIIGRAIVVCDQKERSEVDDGRSEERRVGKECRSRWGGER